jgi:hypothetical protein
VRSAIKWAAGCSAATIVALLWPGPSVSAGNESTSLGGYQAAANAAVVHVEVFEPVIPIPANPEGDVSVGYTQSTVDTGPTTRALSSYLWPGVVIGDGFDQLLNKPGTQYPVQTDSRYPATETAPATNAVQLTDGNGMSTATDGFNTTAKVTGLGLEGPGTNLLDGIGLGLNQLDPKVGQLKPLPTVKAPLPVSDELSALVTSSTITSDSTVTVADKTVTADAHAAVSDLYLLSGLVTIQGLDVDTKVVSDGSKATTSGTASITSLDVAGVKIPISSNGLNLSLPALSTTVNSLLAQFGLSLSIIPVDQTTAGPQGSITGQALEISVDTAPLKKILNTVLDPLAKLIPSGARAQLQPVLDLQPKFVIIVGDVSASASAAPAFTGGTIPGGGFTVGGTTVPGGNTAPIVANDQPMPGQTATSGTTSTPQVQPTAHALPGLGSVPRWLVVGAILLAGLLGWLMTSAAGFLLGGAASCDYGLTTGVPDLRKG